MAVLVLFLGPLRDLAGRQEMELPAPLDWEGLLAAIPAQVSAQVQLERVNVACRGYVLADKRTLVAEDGDEVALLPPVSGG